MNGDTRQFNFTASNKGTQVTVNTYWAQAFTYSNKDPETCVKTPIDITNLTLTGEVKDSAGNTVANLIETVDDTQTGLFRIDSANGQFKVIIDSATSSVITADNVGTYDILLTDALGKTTVFLKGKIEFQIIASS